MDNQMRIIVLGYMVRGPLGGMAWHHMQYVLGLSRLGHDVYFVEDSDDYPSCYDPTRHTTDTDPTYGLAFAARTFDRVGLGDRWAYYDAHTSRWLGPGAPHMQGYCEEADVVLNVSGVNPLRPWLMEAPVRALIDTDPVFTQLKHLTDAEARNRASLHTAFLTFGENIGSDSSKVPHDGLPWRPTRQPIVLDEWPVTPGRQYGAFTTVMQWDSYSAREYDGHRYGMKSASFAPYLTLPLKTQSTLEIALGNRTAPRDVLVENGWTLSDPLCVSRDPWNYQAYIQQSKAEFSVAKQGYVVSQSGWFSERSACYLASGRPVLVQDTGFPEWMETGAGVFAFSNPEEALAGLEDINSRYVHQCRAARDMAGAYFDSRLVLDHMLDEVQNG